MHGLLFELSSVVLDCPFLHSARCVLLCLATVAFFGNFVIEQPGSSILFEHERFQQLCGLLQAGSMGDWLQMPETGWKPRM